MLKIKSENLSPILQDLMGQNIKIFYSETTKDYFIVCSSRRIKALAESASLISALVRSILIDGDFKNVYVVEQSTIFNADNFSLYDIESVKKTI